MSRADLAPVFAKRQVADVVGAVLDRPVAAIPTQKRRAIREVAADCFKHHRGRRQRTPVRLEWGAVTLVSRPTLIR